MVDVAEKSFTRFRATRINGRWQLSQLSEWPVASVLELGLERYVEVILIIPVTKFIEIFAQVHIFI